MVLDTDAGGGVRMVNQPMTMAMLKQRLRHDKTFSESERCKAWARMFLHFNTGDDFWDASEYEEMGCAELNPWLVE